MRGTCMEFFMDGLMNNSISNNEYGPKPKDLQCGGQYRYSRRGALLYLTSENSVVR